MKIASLVLSALAACSVPAFAQQYNLNQNSGAAHAAVCRTSELKTCKDTCKQDHDDNVKLLCSKDAAKEADCKKTQSKMMTECSDGCRKKWCS